MKAVQSRIVDVLYVLLDVLEEAGNLGGCVGSEQGDDGWTWALFVDIFLCSLCIEVDDDPSHVHDLPLQAGRR